MHLSENSFNIARVEASARADRKPNKSRLSPISFFHQPDKPHAPDRVRDFIKERVSTRT